MADAAQQPLVFRVMRLTPPELVPPQDGYAQEDLCSDALELLPPASAAAAAHRFAPRLRGGAVPGDLLSLPMSFG